jgi:hypothetical protein
MKYTRHVLGHRPKDLFCATLVLPHQFVQRIKFAYLLSSFNTTTIFNPKYRTIRPHYCPYQMKTKRVRRKKIKGTISFILLRTFLGAQISRVKGMPAANIWSNRGMAEESKHWALRQLEESRKTEVVVSKRLWGVNLLIPILARFSDSLEVEKPEIPRRTSLRGALPNGVIVQKQIMRDSPE